MQISEKRVEFQRTNIFITYFTLKLSSLSFLTDHDRRRGEYNMFVPTFFLDSVVQVRVVMQV